MDALCIFVLEQAEHETNSPVKRIPCLFEDTRMGKGKGDVKIFYIYRLAMVEDAGG